MNKHKSAPRLKDPNAYAAGWNYRRAKAVADYYDTRKDQIVLGGATGAVPTPGLVWMEVPQELVPKVRKLIARGRKTA